MLDGINLGNEQWATLIGWPEADGIGWPEADGIGWPEADGIEDMGMM